MSKLMTLNDAIGRFVHDGNTVVIEGFTHLICFAAGHEIIRQRRRELTLCRLTPDLRVTKPPTYEELRTIRVMI